MSTGLVAAQEALDAKLGTGLDNQTSANYLEPAETRSLFEQGFRPIVF